MAEDWDYTPAPWAGAAHDFKSARAHYDAHVDRSYDDAKAAGKKRSDLVPDHIETTSTAPLIILCDVTGSMGEWPAVIFSKLPYLEHEVVTEYLGENAEICFGAVGDANTDEYSLQVRPFAKGADLKTRLEELVIEGGGGGQTTETYELAALYAARNIAMPNAVQPICIFIGDEMPYDVVSKEDAKNVAGVALRSRMTTKDVFEELKRKCSVYLIRKPYDESSGNKMSEADKHIHSAWAKLLDEEHILNLPDAGRVVDVIFGILANETGRIDYFRKELEGRQKPEQVKTVYKSLDPLLTRTSGKDKQTRLASGRSVLTIMPGAKGKKTRLASGEKPTMKEL